MIYLPSRNCFLLKQTACDLPTFAPVFSCFCKNKFCFLGCFCFVVVLLLSFLLFSFAVVFILLLLLGLFDTKRNVDHRLARWKSPKIEACDQHGLFLEELHVDHKLKFPPKVFFLQSPGGV